MAEKKIRSKSKGAGESLAPQVTSGDWRNELPDHLLGAFHASRENPDLLHLQDQVALVDTRLSELMTLVKSDRRGDGDVQWKKAVMALRQLERTWQKRDNEMVGIALTRLREILEANADKRSNWAEISSLISLRAKLVDAEAKAQVRLRSLIKTDYAFTVINSLFEVVRNELDSQPELLQRIFGKARSILEKHSGDLGTDISTPAAKRKQLAP